MEWKKQLINVIANLDNGSHSANQLQGVDESISEIIKTEIIEKLVEDAVFLTYKEHEWKEEFRKRLNEKWL